MLEKIMAEKPLMLKDYLEIEIDSQEESSDRFPCYPRLADAATVRHLLAAELRDGAGKSFAGARSAKGGRALTRLSAAIKLKLLPFSSAAAAAAEGRNGEGFLSRSFSKRIRGSFWKKRSEDAEGEGDRKRSVRVKDIVRLRSFEEIEERRSFGCPSPVVSSCGSTSESESSSSSGSDFVSSSIGSSEFLDEIESSAAKKSSPPLNANPNPNPNPNPRVCTVTDIGVRAEAAATGDTKGVESSESMECREMEAEEKEQLSPVAVMDFPYEDEDEDEDEDATTTTTCSSSPSFQQALANIERTKLQLLQKIRRFESLAELDPVDLQSRFAASDEDEDEVDPTCHVAPDDDDDDDDDDDASHEGGSTGGSSGSRTAWALLAVLEASTAGPHHRSFEKLLVDFFGEGLSRDAASSAELLESARDWMQIQPQSSHELRGGIWSRGDLEITEMERNGRWRCFREEKGEITVHLESAIFNSLVEELAATELKIKIGTSW